MNLRDHYTEDADVVLYGGDCLGLLAEIPPRSVQLVVTSPPYNIGKRYERKTTLERYLQDQSAVIGRCVGLLRDGGSVVL